MIRRTFLFLAILLLFPSITMAQTLIGSIQGGGEASPFVGERVTIEGVVTGVFDGGQRDNQNWLVFVQDEGDGDASTSNGVPIYVGKEPPVVGIGDRVRVTGEITEFYDLTELIRADIEVLASGVGLPEPVVMGDAFLGWERLEGMRVTIRGGSILQDGACNLVRRAEQETAIPILMAEESMCVQAANRGGLEATGVLTFHFGEFKVVIQDEADVVFDEELVGFDLISAETCLKITEVYYDTRGSEAEAEWIELTNACSSSLDIGSFTIGDKDNRLAREGMFVFPTGASIEAERSIVIAQNGQTFTTLFGFMPNFEIADSDPNIPQLRAAEFSGASGIQLANSGDNVVLLDAEGALVDAVSYGDNELFLQPAPLSVGEGESLGRVTANCDTDTAADFAPQRTPSPGTAEFAIDCEDFIAAEAGSLQIGRIQGRSAVSPYVNQRVKFRGVVTGLHEDQNAAGTIFYTLYVQDPVGFEDGDPATSDGIGVFFGRNRPTPQIGDIIDIQGTVTEYFGLTEIDDSSLQVELVSSGNTLPTPIDYAPPNGSNDLIRMAEPLEGMRVHLGFGTAKVVGATYDGCGFSVMRSGAEEIGRIYARTGDEPIGSVVPILNDSDVDCKAFPNVNVGDEISGIEGILIYNFEQYKVLTQDFDNVIIDPMPLPEPPVAPDLTGDQFSVISFNVENLFDREDDTGNSAEPKPTERELATKLAKLAYAFGVTANCPTIAAIQEVEKASLLEDLANGVAQYCENDYQVVHLESADARGIDLAFLVDGRRVSVNDYQLARACTDIETNIDDPLANCAGGTEPLFSRPPLMLNVLVDGKPFTFINNHFKSKRGGAQETEARRIEQAKHIATLTADIREQNVIVVGDFNDYERSATQQTLAEHGFENALLRVPEEARYTFVFGGVPQLIDGIFISDALRERLTAATILHTNADYADSLGRDLSQMAFKATDHDIPFVVFDGLGEASAEASPTNNSTSEPANNSLLIGAGVAAMLIVAVGVGYIAGKRRQHPS